MNKHDLLNHQVYLQPALKFNWDTQKENTDN